MSSVPQLNSPGVYIYTWMDIKFENFIFKSMTHFSFFNGLLCLFSMVHLVVLKLY